MNDSGALQHGRIVIEIRTAGGTVMLSMPESGGPEEAKDPGGAKMRGVLLAIAGLWPDGIPAGLSGKDRNNQVRAWLEEGGHSVPADIERAVSRALATRGRVAA